MAVFDLPLYGERTALRDGDETWSYAQLAASVADFQARLSDGRLLVFLEVRNNAASVIAYLACITAGHVVHLYSDYDPVQLDLLTGLYNPHHVIRSCNLDAGDIQPRHGEVLNLHPDLCLLLSTSGSTGAAKFVRLSRGNLTTNADSICTYLGIGPTDSVLLNLKLNYSYGLSVLNTHMRAGGCVVLTEASVADDAFWNILEREKVTSFPGVPYSFEMIERSGRLKDVAGLRYVTQAGGRLDPRLVRHFADEGRRHGWKFFVMYGQTEAAPRISYLPPDQMDTHANCIGIPIPGGRLWLRDDSGAPVSAANTPGELIYEGANVMMGYAEGLSDLALESGPAILATGDVACRNAEGLYYIVGRLKRFVKPFGVRISLDDIESEGRTTAPGTIATGNDKRIVLVSDVAEEIEVLTARLDELRHKYCLPPGILSVRRVAAIPRLLNGKIDYPSLKRDLLPEETVSRSTGPIGIGGGLKRLFSVAFVGRFFMEFAGLMGFGATSVGSFRDVFAELMGRLVNEADSFRSLAGDSLSYVQISLAIEERLGFLPDNWEALTIKSLQERYDAKAV